MHAAVARECLAVRNGVGILDASTLGKIEVAGRTPRRSSTGCTRTGCRTLAVGSIRYGLMLG